MTKTSQTTPPTVTGPAFNTLKLPSAMLDNLQQLGYLTMTPIQAESLPITRRPRPAAARPPLSACRC